MVRHVNTDTTEQSPQRVSSVQPRTALGMILLKSAAEEGGMRALARQVGISPEMIYRFVRGDTVPSKHCQRALADYFNGRSRAGDDISVELIAELAAETDDST